MLSFHQALPPSLQQHQVSETWLQEPVTGTTWLNDYHSAEVITQNSYFLTWQVFPKFLMPQQLLASQGHLYAYPDQE